MTIEEQVNDGIKNAMKAHDKVRLETMRNIKKVILEAKTRPGANDRIDDAECIKLIQKLAKQGKESAGAILMITRLPGIREPISRRAESIRC